MAGVELLAVADDLRTVRSWLSHQDLSITRFV